jgi:hypothetical protein
MPLRAANIGLFGEGLYRLLACCLILLCFMQNTIYCFNQIKHWPFVTYGFSSEISFYVSTPSVTRDLGFEIVISLFDAELLVRNQPLP